jgi:hypothetical protein
VAEQIALTQLQADVFVCMDPGLARAIGNTDTVASIDDLLGSAYAPLEAVLLGSWKPPGHGQACAQGCCLLLSALRVHEIGTQAPHEVWIAIPPHIVSPRLDQPAIRVVRMSEAALADGVDRLKIDGVDVPVFNAVRTIVDCFRFRNKIGLDVALEALRDGWSQRKFTLDDLWRHATAGRVANVMRPYIEAVTA